jgi:hypothetical protein
MALDLCSRRSCGCVYLLCKQVIIGQAPQSWAAREASYSIEVIFLRGLRRWAGV